jgi:hypothetical protein
MSKRPEHVERGVKFEQILLISGVKTVQPDRRNVFQGRVRSLNTEDKRNKQSAGNRGPNEEPGLDKEGKQ